MRGRQEATRSPHRQFADEQRVNEFGNPLSSLPQGGPQELAWEAERDHVISVERIGDEASVFDIQVSKNHNFFANGILV
ncbi:hypothetical protein, partial [Bacillus anthracis]|uniref:hypothetical protein n=1 Tax=Bacillus anthracis TaxID=1392 RepID=UPI00349F42B8